ncbi:DUF4179 domain-containing protein [Clostridium sp. DSM 100503]|uniref:DUF4179 domain-containing protein n=1 Tax=Clostridium sp. DSM 100503 TaxID=2963282 RepID=UPI00214A6DD2|nr:DUF4179 domain-containing protein [Clostridium sp. DSM 100503]MCR1949854.1 DUF4179 domain-containing protein [Clostridium sp. DSM 100503]
MKSIYDKFNKVEMNLDEYEEFFLNEDEINIIKKRLSSKLNKKRKYNYKPLVATLAGIFIFSILSNNDVVSAGIENISRNLRQYFRKEINRNFSEYITPIGTTVTDKNISITVNEIIVDEDLIIINETLDYSKLTEEDGLLFKNKERYTRSQETDVEVNINGEISKQAYSDLYNVSDDVINMISIYSFNDINLDNTLDIKIKYKFYDFVPNEMKPNSGTVYPIEGNWKFNFSINADDIKKSIQRVELDENNIIEMPNGDIVKITEASRSDISFKFRYEIITNEKEDYYSSSYFYAVDNDGERLEGSTSNYNFRDFSGYSQYIMKDRPQNKFTIKAVGGKNTVTVDFDDY